ncbi:MAG: ABC transporter ATP-binding protein [Actinobacteria bacterium]|nr:ABC transporter ATP-binding protein [Actinomycetota bacterium]
MHLLEGEQVTKHFGGLAAVADVDFYVDEGEILGLIGPNGAGKTTLFNLISAALSPTHGKISYKGREITGLAPHQICRLGIARTFQTVKIFPHVPVVRNVMVGSLFGTGRRTSEGEALKKAEAALDFVDLTPLRDVPAGDLTLANQKRLEVARALATDPHLLLLDELMAGLTHTEITEAMGDIGQIRGRGITVIMIEHVMHAIMGTCDRIIVLDHGRKIAEGTPAEIAVNQQVIECYLGQDTSGDEEDAGS